MPHRALIRQMIVFLGEAKTEWARLAEDAELAGKDDEALHARNQEAHCEMEIVRYLAALAESERP